jgi:hypothetical protein
MSRSNDLRSWLESWPYDPEHDVRLARGEDGREILQVRLPMGLEQYELDGRPDGQRPRGAESLLAYHLARFQEAKAAGKETEFALTAEECAELFTEGTLYYCRYLRLFELKDWARTIRDTGRNLSLFEFVHHHAEREEDQMYLEKWRPYVLRMNATAAAMLALERDAHDQALQLVHQATQRIEALDELDDEAFRFERGRSLLALQELREHIEQIRPLPELERLQRELARAIETQAFERAAELRDRIRTLRAGAAQAPNP